MTHSHTQEGKQISPSLTLRLIFFPQMSENRRPDRNDVIESKIKLFSAQIYLADAEEESFFFFLFHLQKVRGSDGVSL